MCCQIQHEINQELEREIAEIKKPGQGNLKTIDISAFLSNITE